MAEAIISPGIFLNENDLTQIQQGPITAGAALIGPTVKGPANQPVVVTSYSDFTNIFGSIFLTGSSVEEYITSIAAYNYFQQGGDTLIVTRVVSGSTDQDPNGAYTVATSSIPAIGNGASFELETIAVGANQNSGAQPESNNGYLPSGSVNNVRWEVVFSDVQTGLFTLAVRRGDDYDRSKVVLETWSNLSLDPGTPNYIEYQIGNISFTPFVDENGDWNLRQDGNYPNNSRYIRVKPGSVRAQPGYLQADGTPVNAATASMPQVGSGSFNTAVGDDFGGQTSGHELLLFESIPTSALNTTDNSQGLVGSDYDIALSLLKNKDWYDYQEIYVPGLTIQNAYGAIDSVLDVVESRGDSIAILDTTGPSQTVATASIFAGTVDSNYAATYWPWVQVRSSDTGKIRLVPASTVMPGVYAYNDKVSAEWFAPAGLNRGSLANVLGPELRLTKTNRDTLYNNKVNPVAVFPGVGTVVYGQKTLQNKPSALDRVNVRRLLIALKRQVRLIAENFLFEQNNAATRAKFVNQITPYMDSVQQRQGLYAYRIVMDETNNPPSVVDRNQLFGAIYIQPTRAVEYIILDFNILPTGATFGQG